MRVEHPDWTNAYKPQVVNWFPMPCPFKGGPFYAAGFAAGGRLRNELYIDFGDEGANTALFEQLAVLKSDIERDYGGALVWEELAGKRACRIADYREGDVTNADAFDDYIDWFFDSGARLRLALGNAADKIWVAKGPL